MDRNTDQWTDEACLAVMRDLEKISDSRWTEEDERLYWKVSSRCRKRAEVHLKRMMYSAVVGAALSATAALLFLLGSAQ
jgi:hypothetical protein